MYTNVSNELENEIDADRSRTALRVWDGISVVEKAACRWMRENKFVWESWEPKGGNGKVPLFIGGIFPITGSYTARGILVGKKALVLLVDITELLSHYLLRNVSSSALKENCPTSAIKMMMQRKLYSC